MGPAADYDGGGDNMCAFINMARINLVTKNINALLVNINLLPILFQADLNEQNHFQLTRENIPPALFVANPHFFIMTLMIILIIVAMTKNIIIHSFKQSLQ